ncbi:MAG TPA: diacylglycerol kinase [Candidatus Paceibacterota bacterium]|nr:diacylglycerol kinase [Candidatus Paceibacterota bacterium]
MLITAVISLELFNTSLEHFLDLFHPEINAKVRNIKDLIAGGVAIVSIGAGIIGGIIFIPKIFSLIQIYFKY